MARFSWRGIFVLLAVGSGIVFILNLIFLPETNRQIVDNLSVFPEKSRNRLPIIYKRSFAGRMHRNTLLSNNTQLHYNPLTPYKIFFNFHIFLSLLAAGLQFMVWTMALASLSTSLENSYHFPMIKVGLCYLSSGLATLIGSIASGRILDWNYKRHFEKTKAFNEENNPSCKFNLSRARLEVTLIPTFLLIGCFMVFGWCLDLKTNIAPILISAFVFSFCTVFFMSSLTVLLVDLFPESSSSLTSSLNLMRCLLASLGVGVLQNIIDTMGIGFCYVLMGGLCGTGALLIYFFQFILHKSTT